MLGPEGQSLEIDAVVDTGYSGALTLPTSVVTALGLTFRNIEQATLADGSEVELHTYYVTVTWDGVDRYIYAFVADNVPLLGMSLLDGHDLSVQVRRGGRVLIQQAVEG